MMTPLESRSDVTVRTLNNPLKSCFRSGLLAHRSGAAWSEDDVIKPLAWLPPGLPPCCCARVLSRSMHACVHVRGAGFDEGRSNLSLQRRALIRTCARCHTNATAKLLWPPTLRALYDLMEEGRMQAAKSPQLSQPLFVPFLRSSCV